MTFLELCQRAVQESGVGNLQLTAVTNQTGLLAKFVNWTREAWIDLQNEPARGWRFLQRTHDFTTIAAQSEYTFAGDFNLQESSQSIVAVPERLQLLEDDGRKRRLRKYDWREWMADVDVLPDSSGEPARWALAADGSGIIIDRPAPDGEYSMRLHYRRSAQRLAATTDAPIIPQDHHMVIVWKALTYYAAHDEAPASMAGKWEREYRFARRKLIAAFGDTLELRAEPIA